MKSRPLALGLLGLLLAGFGFGVLSLMKLRFESGDIYPPYSSLRADPLGVKVFYESLAKLEGFAVSRSYRELSKLSADQPVTLFYLGEQPRSHWPEQTLKQFESLARNGSRIVISFRPVSQTNELGRAAESRANDGPRDPDRERRQGLRERRRSEETSEADESGRWVRLAESWGVRLQTAGSDPITTSSARASRSIDAELPSEIAWPAALWFELADPAWKPIYQRVDRPVFIERGFGRGSIVLCSDSYFLSNEAMLLDRQAAVLAWLLGASRQAVFDEAHLGIRENPGLASLARKYRLHGVLAALLALAALFVWKNSFAFMPAHEQPSAREDVLASGKDATEGFINLLRRNIPPGELLPVCYEQWKATAGREKSAQRAELDFIMAAEQARPARARDPLGAYQRISKLFEKRKRL